MNYCACYQAVHLVLYQNALDSKLMASLKRFLKFSFFELNFVFHYLIRTECPLVVVVAVAAKLHCSRCVKSRIE